MASTILRANQFRRVPGDGEANSNIKSGDTLTFDSGSELVIASGATLTTSGTVALGSGATLTQPSIVELSEVVTTTNVITAAESGKTFYLNLAGGFTSTLPVPALGLYYRFVVKTAPTTAYIITTNAGANLFFGTVANNGAETEANGVDIAAQDTINFVANQAKVGDYVDVRSDGTNWYVSGMVQDLANLTVAVT